MTFDQRALVPEHKDLGLELADVSPEGRFSGYASLFGVADLGADIVERGAFSASLALRGEGAIRMLWQHDPAEVIGRWLSIREDATGLFVEGELMLAVARAREAHELMKAGALDGLSIGFRTIRSRRDAPSGRRHILEADLWEISVVTFPMQPGARVSRIKSGEGGGEAGLAMTIDRATRLIRRAA